MTPHPDDATLERWREEHKAGRAYLEAPPVCMKCSTDKRSVHMPCPTVQLIDALRAEREAGGRLQRDLAAARAEVEAECQRANTNADAAQELRAEVEALRRTCVAASTPPCAPSRRRSRTMPDPTPTPTAEERAEHILLAADGPVTPGCSQAYKRLVREAATEEIRAAERAALERAAQVAEERLRREERALENSHVLRGPAKRPRDGAPKIIESAKIARCRIWVAAAIRALIDEEESRDG